MHFPTVFYTGVWVLSPLVAGHAAIIRATGDQGGNGSAIGIDGSTPRDGTGRNPFQQDSTRFKGDAADSCGETVGAGANDPEAGTKAVMAVSGGQLPQISPGGTVNMTLHQVNADGAGPYTCMIDATGTGTNWQNIDVAQNVPGNAKGRNRDGAVTDFSLVAQVPAGQTCSGNVAGQANVCMVRCQNPARAGPFGGCVPVQMAGGASAAAGNATGAAAGAANAGGAASAGGATAAGTGATGAGAGTSAAGTPAAGAGTSAGTGATGANSAAGASTGSTGSTGSTSSTGTGASASAADDEDDEEDDEGDSKNKRQTRRRVIFWA